MLKEAPVRPSAATANVEAAPGQGDRRLSLTIEGMTCASCVRRVEQAIETAPGVADASVNLATERAEIRFKDRKPDVAGVSEAIRRAGYDTRTVTIELAVRGMSCASCVGRIEKVLNAVPGVVEASVNLATETANAELISGVAEPGELVSAIKSAGYDAEQVEQNPDRADRERVARNRETRRLRRSMILAGTLTIPVFILEMGSHFVPIMHEWVMTDIGRQESWYLQFALTTLVLFGPGLVFFRKGVPALVRWAPDMNSLVALGTGAAWSYSVVVTFAEGLLPEGTQNVYYEAAAVIVTLILLGRYLEAIAKGRTSEAISVCLLVLRRLGDLILGVV